MKFRVVISVMFTLTLFLTGCAKHSGGATASTASTTPSPVVDGKEATLKEKIFQAGQQLTIHNNRAAEAESRGDSNTRLSELQQVLAIIQQRDSAQMELAAHYKEAGRNNEAADLFRSVYKSCGETNPLGQQARDQLIAMHERLE